jgi:hypothetical protein
MEGGSKSMGLKKSGETGDSKYPFLNHLEIPVFCFEESPDMKGDIHKQPIP